MASSVKMRKTFIVISVITVVVTIWIFVIVLLQFLHPQYPESMYLNNLDDPDWLIKMLEEENDSTQTISMYPRTVKDPKEKILKVNINMWTPEVLRLNIQENSTLNISVDAVEEHFEIIQNSKEIKIITDLTKCKTFQVDASYVLNNDVIAWKAGISTIHVLSRVTGSEKKINLGKEIRDLLAVVNENVFVWTDTSNNIMITNGTDTKELFKIEAKPKALEIFGDILCILSNDSFTLCNTATSEYNVIEVVADVILSPKLVLKLLNQRTGSVLLELIGTMEFVELPTPSHIDTDKLDDLYVYRQGNRVVMVDGLKGTLQILGNGNKIYLPLKNLKVKYMVSTSTNDFRIFLSSGTAIYIITVISGRVENVITRSDLNQVCDINRGFMVTGKDNCICTVLPSNVASLKAKIKSI